jgi:hypothetical protein
MTEQQAKNNCKLTQAINDAIKVMPDTYTLEQQVENL